MRVGQQKNPESNIKLYIPQKITTLKAEMLTDGGRSGNLRHGGELPEGGCNRVQNEVRVEKTKGTRTGIK